MSVTEDKKSIQGIALRLQCVLVCVCSLCSSKLLSLPPSTPDLDKLALCDPLSLTMATDHLQRYKKRGKRKLWSKESASAVWPGGMQ